MTNKGEALNILETIKTKAHKRPFNISINTNIVDEFSIVCSLEKVSKSEVIEHLILGFLDTYVHDKQDYKEIREELLSEFQNTGKIPNHLVSKLKKKSKN